jgi:tetratricopeptide (TPR) repeat protein
LWIGAGIILLACIGALWLVRSSRLAASIRRARNETPVVTPLLPSIKTPVQLPPPGPDADSHLNLALEAWRTKDLRRSMEEVNQVVALRLDQTDYLIEAGGQLFDAGQFIGAALVYAHAAKNLRDIQQPMTPEIRNRLDQSFYFGVEQDAFPLYIPFDNLTSNDLAIGFFAQSRYALLHGNMDVAYGNRDELLRLQPDWSPAQLLNAEILLHDGKLLEARRILQDLTQSPRPPDWVKEQAGILLSKSQ